MKRATSWMHHVWWVLGFALRLFLECEWEWMCEWMYDFTMTVICALWTVGKDVEGLTSNVRNEESSGTTYQSHQESAWGAAQARKDRRSLCRLLEGAVLLLNGGGFVGHVYKLFFSSIFSDANASEVGEPWGAGSNLRGCHPLLWTAAGEEEDYWLNTSCLVSFGFCS